MYLARCDIAPLAAVSRGRWTSFAWSDSGMQSADPTIGPGWSDASTVVPMLWRHFEAANERFGVPIALLEIGSFKRYGPGADCPAHVDDPQPMTGGRLLSMTVVVEASDDLAGGDLVLDVNGVDEPVSLGAGQLAVFPASAQHWVTTVTRGTRMVLVARALAADGFVAGEWLWRPDGSPSHRCPAPTGAQIREYQRQLASSR